MCVSIQSLLKRCVSVYMYGLSLQSSHVLYPSYAPFDSLEAAARRASYLSTPA